MTTTTSPTAPPVRDDGLWGKGQIISYEELDSIPLPDKTATYVPVPHRDFLYNINSYLEEILGPKGYQVTAQQQIVTHEGRRMFGVIRLANGASECQIEGAEMMIAHRNSYDKSMSAGLALGAQCIACSNLYLGGEIVVMRKHTGDVLEYLHEHLILALFRATDSWRQLSMEVQVMRQAPLCDEDAYGMLGRAAVNRAIQPMELINAAKAWQGREPSYDYGPDTLHRLYSCVTQVMRTVPPHQIMQRHRRWHNWARSTPEYLRAA